MSTPVHTPASVNDNNIRKRKYPRFVDEKPLVRRLFTEDVPRICPVYNLDIYPIEVWEDNFEMLDCPGTPSVQDVN